MAYDSRRRVMVMFGGRTSSSSGPYYFNETWEWDGATWHLRAAPGPTGRVGQGMAYDSNRGVVVMHAAYHPATPVRQETWEWDGNTWSLRDSSYSNRNPNLAFDERRGVMVSVRSLDFPPETWEWDGLSWTQRITPQHPAMFYYSAAMAYDSRRGVCVLYNGLQVSEFDGNDWTLIGAGEPGQTELFQMCHNAERGESTFCSGTDDSTVDGRVWAWNGYQWRVETNPVGRANDSAFAYDTNARVSYLFGSVPNTAGEFWRISDIPCDSDVDGDYDVDIQDLATLLGHFGQVEGGSLENGDLDADGDIDLQDLALLLARFGQPC